MTNTGIASPACIQTQLSLSVALSAPSSQHRNEISLAFAAVKVKERTTPCRLFPEKQTVVSVGSRAAKVQYRERKSQHR